jgi:hypothetical protein
MEGDGTTARVLIGWVDEKNLQIVEQLVCIAIGLITCADFIYSPMSISLSLLMFNYPTLREVFMTFLIQLQLCCLRSLFYGPDSICQELVNW